MYIYQDEQQWISYTICGDVGKRIFTLDWRVSKYQQVPELYRFSATFYEDKPGRILLRYIEISDQGSAATVGVEGTKNKKSKPLPYEYMKLWSLTPAQLYPPPTRTSQVRSPLAVLLYGTVLRGAPPRKCSRGYAVAFCVHANSNTITIIQNLSPTCASHNPDPVSDSKSHLTYLKTIILA
jgi:hypothetical protein